MIIEINWRLNHPHCLSIFLVCLFALIQQNVRNAIGSVRRKEMKWVEWTSSHPEKNLSSVQINSIRAHVAFAELLLFHSFSSLSLSFPTRSKLLCLPIYCTYVRAYTWCSILISVEGDGDRFAAIWWKCALIPRTCCECCFTPADDAKNGMRKDWKVDLYKVYYLRVLLCWYLLQPSHMRLSIWIHFRLYT